MNYKGFTLVELLAVIVLMALVTIISFVTISSINRHSKEDEYNRFKESLYNATEAYVVIHQELLTTIDTEGELLVPVKTLLDDKAINKINPNPKTNVVEANAFIKVTKDNAGVLIFDYINNN